MSWRAATHGETDEVLSFLKLKEWSCVSFTSRLLARDQATNRVLINRSVKDHDRIMESLLVTDHGLVVPAIEPTDDRCEERERELRPLIRSAARRVHSILGLSEQVSAIETLLECAPSHRVEYHLMTHEYFSVPRTTPPPEGISVRRATLADLPLLYPLQRAYEREEVLLNPNEFNATGCLLQLQKSLRKEIIFLAERGGKVIGKAGTNARGINYYQVGGVFTSPELRNRGVGRALMGALMAFAAESQKHICLFVKVKNDHALRLYRGLGFVIRNGFTISYFRS